jgi:hypothetical protein
VKFEHVDSCPPLRRPTTIWCTTRILALDANAQQHFFMLRRLQKYALGSEEPGRGKWLDKRADENRLRLNNPVSLVAVPERRSGKWSEVVAVLACALFTLDRMMHLRKRGL